VAAVTFFHVWCEGVFGGGVRCCLCGCVVAGNVSHSPFCGGVLGLL